MSELQSIDVQIPHDIVRLLGLVPGLRNSPAGIGDRRRGKGRRIYKDTSANLNAVSDHVQRLRQAEGVIFVFPSWWYGMPAILKGYFDRVWLPGVAFEFGPQAIKPLLGSLRLFGVVTTTGAPAWFARFYMGNPSRKVLMRGLARLLVAPRAERLWSVIGRASSIICWLRYCSVSLDTCSNDLLLRLVSASKGGPCTYW